MANDYALYHRQSHRSYPLTATQITIGRDAHCEIRLGDADASREHARLFVSAGGLTLVDLDSTNGTYVNDSLVNEPYHLEPGDCIRIGQEEFSLAVQDQTDATSLSGAPVTQLDAKQRHAQRVGRAFTNFLGLFPFAEKFAQHHGSFADSHRETIERYVAYFRQASHGESGAVLFFYKDDETLGIHCVTEEHHSNSWSVGRSETSYIIVNDASVSKHHADLYYQTGHWLLEDRKSTNGLYQWGEAKQSIQLFNGSDLRLGDVKLFVRLF